MPQEIEFRVKFYTVAEVAAEVGQTRQWISDRCKKQKIHAIASKKGYLIPESELDKFRAPFWRRGRPKGPLGKP